MDASEILARRTSAAMRREVLAPNTDKALAAKVTEFLDLRRRAIVALNVSDQAADIMRRAESADRAAAADAVVAGESAAEVGTPAQDEARAKISAANVEFAALSDALEMAWAELQPEHRAIALDEERAARDELAARRIEVEAALDVVAEKMADWRASAHRISYWAGVRDGKYNFSPGAMIGVRGVFVDRGDLNTSDVRRELQAVSDLLDPPVRQRDPETEQHTSAKAPARVR